MISASTITTIITPDQTPALKMPSISEQLAKVLVRKATIANGKYLLIMTVGFRIITTIVSKGFLLSLLI